MSAKLNIKREKMPDKVLYNIAGIVSPNSDPKQTIFQAHNQQKDQYRSQHKKTDKQQKKK